MVDVAWSMFPSVSYECSQIPCICLDWMQKPFHMGLGPQPMHNNIIFIFSTGAGETQEFHTSSLSLRRTNILDVAWWQIHLPNNTIWMFLYYTLDMFWLGVKTIPCGSGASANAPWHHTYVAQVWPKNSTPLRKFEPNKHGGYGMMVDPSTNL